jgi:hypothetical protein
VDPATNPVLRRMPAMPGTRPPARFSLGLAAGAAAVALSLGAAGGRTADRPPAAHTGGFGEPSCQACHTDAPPGSGPGALALHGVPECFEPHAAYAIDVVLQHPHLRAAGFQLAVRHADGTQAGVLTAAGEDVSRVGVTSADSVTYAHHLYPGTRPAGVGGSRWRVTWRAPGAAQAVRFHAAAVAGDDDLSPLGDAVYTISASSCES